MRAEREGPPEKERPSGSQAARPDQKSATTTDKPKPTTQPRQCHADTVTAQWRRRRQASQRMVPLDCGCQDPWPCRCTWPPLSEQQIDAGRDAARHVLATGNVPLLELEVLRALYRRGGDDRALAEQLHEACGGMAS